MMNTRKAKGFTLIELMIVVAIVGIISAIAYPSYQDSVKKGRRADAKSVLLEAAQFMERNYSEANSYAKDSSGTALSDLPAALKKSPKDGTTKFYDIGIQANDAKTFTLRATPVSTGPQSGDGNLEITNTGVKTWGSVTHW